MRVLQTPQPWIAAALALIAVAAVLLVVGRRRAARAAPPVPSAPPAPPAPPAPSVPSAPSGHSGPLGAGTARHRAVPRPAPSPIRTGRSEGDRRRRPSGDGPTVRMLHGGATPSQVAAVLGVDEDELARRVAGELGLFGSRVQGAGRGTKRTVEPGRAWATAGSASSSTTPTTG